MSTTEMTKPLSPSAQAIEDAYFNADGFGYRNALAATLRAAANQIIEEVSPVEALLTIAAELENN
jgi:hypothetical protein